MDRNQIPISVLLTLAFCINCQELEAQLADKEVSLPPEPSSDDDNAVNLMVKMPDGSRRGRRFLRSHKLQVKMPVIKYAASVFLLYFGAYMLNKSYPGNFQSLFNFIDIGRQVKPSSYRLVRNPNFQPIILILKFRS